jgi:two-component system response regulator (stage 0 sporulation protein A)
MMKTRIMLVDDSKEFTQQVKDYFCNSQIAEIAFTAGDGKEALDILAKESVDLLLLDLVMPVMDGFSVLERLGKSSMKVIIISELSQDIFIAKAMNLGADYYMLKPFSMSALEEKITDIMKKTSRPIKNKSMDERLSNIFITVGIPAHIKGYQFLREAIKMAIENPDIINSITKRLYPSVADRFATSPSKVERAIRHAIEVAWNRGKIENINSLFGVRVYNHNEKPTNGEFIALVADKMLLESV